MKKARLKCLCLIIVFFLFAVFGAGCGPAQIVGQWTTKNFALREAVSLNEPVNIDKIVNVGRDLGYEVMGVDEEVGVITFSRSSASAISNFLIRKADHLTLVISILEEGKRLRIESSSIGNFGSGGEQSARNAIALFKERLQNGKEAKLF